MVNFSSFDNSFSVFSFSFFTNISFKKSIISGIREFASSLSKFVKKDSETIKAPKSLSKSQIYL
jgi:hypothetical protein